MRTNLLVAIAVAFISCSLFAQDSASGSPQKLQSQLSQLAGWMGEWHCDGKFIKSGAPISSMIRLSSALQGRWIEMQQDDLPPNRFHAVEFWGYDEDARRFTATVFDNFSQSSRVFEGKAINNGVLTWNRNVTSGPSKAEQFIFENADNKLKITYQVMRDNSWAIGDVLTCVQR
jgi:hypothetical protein